MEEKKRQIIQENKSYKDLLNLQNNLNNQLPTSYDMIGNIIIIKLDNSLIIYKREIGSALLNSNKNVKTVCMTQPVSGEFRTRDLEIIAGEKNTETTHREHGLNFLLDVKKTYFSPRLATERKYITDLVKPNEVIVDMFAGVAPFSIMIAKYSNPQIVYAFDKNPEAVKYAQKNIVLNNVLDKVEMIEADSKNVYKILSKKNVRADRVIMNLPFSAHEFFNFALDIASDNCVIHLYDILKEEKFEERIKTLKQIAEKKGFMLKKFLIRKIKTYAPREFYIGIDITVKKKKTPM